MACQKCVAVIGCVECARYVVPKSATPTAKKLIELERHVVNEFGLELTEGAKERCLAWQRGTRAALLRVPNSTCIVSALSAAEDLC